ncbi:AraC family transcriptional regulator [Evansella sp. AB-P1]|uniref:AraC family transcriptional regulator n=1 Tax=Evansella sp. AB-P1 TaxID=3037653 RepID=UPI00241DA2FD|nr:AraC family transcriptional regulator [Evansella sp. AB-P1]MDG5787208.1 AraC family transcriptional regulator [Evansella sp. AB-P1]
MATRIPNSKYLNDEAFPFYIMKKMHTKDDVPPLHSHEFIELVYVVGGKAEHMFEGQRYLITAGDVFIINPGERHSYNIQENDEIEIINCLFSSSLINESWLSKLGISQSMDYFYVHPFLDEKKRFHHRLNVSEDSEEIVSILEKMLKEINHRQTSYSTLIKLQLVELLVLLSRLYQEKHTDIPDSTEAFKNSQLLVKRICGYLERHFDQKLTVENISKIFNISSRQLNRIFKQELNKSVIEVIQHIRIERAKKMLVCSNDKVITVAVKVGYDDPAFFSRLFTRYVGYPPGKFRRYVKQNLNIKLIHHGVEFDDVIDHENV